MSVSIALSRPDAESRTPPLAVARSGALGKHSHSLTETPRCKLTAHRGRVSSHSPADLLPSEIVDGHFPFLTPDGGSPNQTDHPRRRLAAQAPARIKAPLRRGNWSPPNLPPEALPVWAVPEVKGPAVTRADPFSQEARHARPVVLRTRGGHRRPRVRPRIVRPGRLRRSPADRHRLARGSRGGGAGRQGEEPFPVRPPSTCPSLARPGDSRARRRGVRGIDRRQRADGQIASGVARSGSACGGHSD